MDQQELAFIASGTAKWYRHFRRQLEFLTKLNIFSLYNPAIVLLGIYPKELKIYVHTETCTLMFIAALFIIAKTWKKLRCPSVSKWTNNLWYIQTMEYYSVLKTNEPSSH